MILSVCTGITWPFVLVKHNTSIYIVDTFYVGYPPVTKNIPRFVFYLRGALEDAKNTRKGAWKMGVYLSHQAHYMLFGGMPHNELECQ